MVIGEADDELSRAFRPGASPVAAGSGVTAPATQNKHICRNVAECVCMAGRRNRDLLMQSKSNYVAQPLAPERTQWAVLHAGSQDKMRVRVWGWA